jgi:hypothetical protein
MRTRIYMAVLVAGLAAAGQTRAQYCELEKLHVRSDGEGVSADFSSVDTTTCDLGIETAVHVEASRGVITTADLCGRGAYHIRSVQTSQSNVVAVVVRVFDRCLATQLLSVTGTGVADDLHVNANFKTASLRASIEGVDDFDQPVSIAIDLAWTGVGQKERTVDHVNDHEGIFRLHYTSSGTIRDAFAVGSVIVEDIDRTPLTSTRGTIERDAAHEVIVYR